MTPKLSQKNTKSLTISGFSGGMNQRDGKTEIADNQLTMSNNMWYKDGLLASRPGFQASKTALIPDNPQIFTYPKIIREFSSVSHILILLKYSDRLVFKFANGENFKDVCEITDIPSANFNCNVFSYNEDIYILCSGYYSAEAIPYYAYKITSSGSTFKASRITDDDIYAPLFMQNCLPSETTGFEYTELSLLPGEMVEELNSFGVYYRMQFIPFNPESSWVDMYETHAMRYHIAFPVDGEYFKGKKVTAKLTAANGKVYTHTVVISGAIDDYSYETVKNPVDEMWMAVRGGAVYFFAYPDGTGMDHMVRIGADEYASIEITAPRKRTVAEIRRVMNMTVNEWYGGGSDGIYGGTHLILGGNTISGERSVICWSREEQPLYFTDKSYTYVGNKSAGITAFAKQGDDLIIFKANSIFAARYKSTAGGVKFPISEINDVIGCDAPKSIQLCRNRLVWLNSSGKVYTLVSANQYNQRAVLEISALIEKSLTSYSAANLKSARSANWQGCYVLIIAATVYLMEYDSYGFVNISHYTKSTDAQMYIPWWKWFLPKDKETWLVAAGVYNNADNLSFILSGKTNELYTVKGEKDIVASTNDSGVRSLSEQPIDAYLTTKYFDFGSPTKVKLVPRIEFIINGSAGGKFQIEVISEQGTKLNEIILENGADNGSGDLFEKVVISPTRLSVHRMAVKLSANVPIALETIRIAFKQLQR